MKSTITATITQEYLRTLAVVIGETPEDQKTSSTDAFGKVLLLAADITKMVEEGEEPPGLFDLQLDIAKDMLNHFHEIFDLRPEEKPSEQYASEVRESILDPIKKCFETLERILKTREWAKSEGIT